MTDTIEITVNGEARSVAPGTTVGGLLDELGMPRERVAVELNRRVVRKAEWAAAELASGDRLEIVHFVGGG
jgi:thiamine biosynthesis protein ThiS